MSNAVECISREYKPYPEYKDSGIKWLGKIPKHWSYKRLKYLISQKLQYGANESTEHDNPKWPRYVRITDIDENGYLREETFCSLPPKIANPYILKEGDILFARNGATVGKTFQYNSSWGPSCFAGYLILCCPNVKIIDPEYLYYLTKSDSYLSWKKSIFIHATIENIVIAQ